MKIFHLDQIHLRMNFGKEVMGMEGIVVMMELMKVARGKIEMGEGEFGMELVKVGRGRLRDCS